MKYKVNKEKFKIEDYNNTTPFASFLPAIAGIWGQPLWVFYTNRGQGISSFGVRDKDGAILEFEAANKAYRHTTVTGFRTFIKTSEGIYEPFSAKIGTKSKQTMTMAPQVLAFEDINTKLGIKTQIEYFIVPHEGVPALARKLTISNLTHSKMEIEVLDGLPTVKPYGLPDEMIKKMSRLSEALFGGVQFLQPYGAPLFKLQIASNDKPETNFIDGANFYYGFWVKDNRKIKPKFIVDPENVFGNQNDLSFPTLFANNNFSFSKKTLAQGKTPAAMGFIKINCDPLKTLNYYSFLGSVSNLEQLKPFLKQINKTKYYATKKEETEKLFTKITSSIQTISNYPFFDTYLKQSYLDNILRGGYPIVVGNKTKKIYHTFSRVHGDMEREYNNFVIEPGFFSQGTGNYRDVNQNRRSDIFFLPEIRDTSILYFLNLIQLDGFNPLKVLGTKFKIRNAAPVLQFWSTAEAKKMIQKFFLENNHFTIGLFFNFLDKNKFEYSDNKEKILDALIDNSEMIQSAEHGEGFWTDHWHYNTDLLEAFLGIYPDYFEDLFIKKIEFKYYDNSHIVLPRKEKYVLYKNFPAQINAVIKDTTKENIIKQRKKNIYWVHTAKGEILKTNLLSKLLIIIINKMASLDPSGIGIEMEADKPDWDDALNGIPGLFGSSVSETFELKRLILFVLNRIEGIKSVSEILFIEEAFNFLQQLHKLCLAKLPSLKFWDQSHKLKEKYREAIKYGVSGKTRALSLKEIKIILTQFTNVLDKGLTKALDKSNNLYYTFFYHEVQSYTLLKYRGKNKLSRQGYPLIEVKKFKRHNLPFFLEGQVHALKIRNKLPKKSLHDSIMKSELYDRKLKMLKVNAPLVPKNYRYGRISAFPRGWLENESIWLHMEYKYLLELLKQGLEKEYYSLIKTTLVPFMEPSVYGRSFFENVSFIVSSGYPEKEKHGQGFQARLSGSTAELLSMWVEMTSGSKPFFLKDNQLYFKLQPKISKEFFTSQETFFSISSNKLPIKIAPHSFAFIFLGSVLIWYYNPKRKNTFGPNKAIVLKMQIEYQDGKILTLKQDYLPEPLALDLRNKKIKILKVFLG